MSWRQAYPFEPHFLETHQGKIHFLDEGTGSPLLFVHGNPTWSFYWRNLVGEFRRHHRCVAIDHLGCGLSDKPDTPPYSLALRIEHLVKLIEHLDLRAITLLVHDWGGAIGLGAALKMPERIERLILFNTGAFPPPFVPWRILACRMPVVGRWGVQGANLFARAALHMATEKPARFTKDVREGLLAPYDTWQHRRAVFEFVTDIPLTRRHATWNVLAEIEKGLPSLAGKPTQLIWGMRDWCFTPACLDRFRAIFPQAETHALSDCGHYVVEDAHERIVPLVRSFLERTPCLHSPSV